MSMVTIRPVTETDNGALAKIVRAAFVEFSAPTRNTVFEDPATDRLSGLFEAAGSRLWVAEQDGILLGCCGIYPTDGLPEGCIELVKFYLSDSARGKGVGAALFRKCMESARALNCKEIYLESLPQFATAVGMYEKLGFKKLDHPLGNSGHTGCTIWMLKAL
ncbi:GNAT family N-acetyltransferase [Niabella aurantiaca]|uniref:GNAT family N-acetyltransferase n=1 Tax=Niabella aurantiaca TaxID=379900 RepID=UPI000380AD25|nr:GNAT family N-acetyltransferase [Niabella aurantiaca]